MQKVVVVLALRLITSIFYPFYWVKAMGLPSPSLLFETEVQSKKSNKNFVISQKMYYLCNALSPDGGIGRRAGLKHQWSNPSRFDPGSGYKSLNVKPCKLNICRAFLLLVCTKGVLNRQQIAKR